MDGLGPQPWKPERAWADPFIATLALVIVLMVSVGLRHRSARPAPRAERVTLQGRVADLALAAPHILGGHPGASALAQDPLHAFADRDLQGWDGAVLAVHAAEGGDLDRGRRYAEGVPGPAGEAFQQAWAWGFQGTGAAPSAAELRMAADGLGRGYAAGLLESRCAWRSGGDPAPALERARAWALPRLALLIGLSLAATVLLLGGLTFMVFLALSRPGPRSLPRYGMSGRAVLLVLLGWFLTHLAASFVLGPVVAGLPFLQPFSLPLVYLFHASLGTWYLLKAEDATARELRARLLAGPRIRALAYGVGYLALAFTVVMAIAMALSPFLRNAEPPQRELMDLVARARNPLAMASIFLTAAVVAPVFEELLFRGFLLPWLGERLEARLGRRAGWNLALAVTAIAFGAMHLEPLGLPTLCTLGFVLGMAYLRTGNLLTSILVHGLWNGGIFIFMRTLG